MRKTALSAFLLALIVVGASRTWAQNVAGALELAGGAKPVAVLSIAKYDEVIADLGYCGELAGQPGLDKTIDFLLQQFTQGQGLKGLDKSRPWGIAVLNVNDQLQPLAFLPVKNMKDLLGVLAPLGIQPEEQGGGIVALQVGPQRVFAKDVDGWAYIAQTAESLASPPKDPSKLLAGLNPEYDIAIRVAVQNVPEMYRSMAIDQLREGFDKGLQRQPNEDDSDFEVRQKLSKAQLDEFISAVNEAEDFTVGWVVDRTKKTSNFDLKFSAKPGTKLAESLAAVQPSTSQFSGFKDLGAAAALNVVNNKVAPKDAERFQAQLDVFLAKAKKEIDNDKDLPDAKSKATAKEAVADLADVIKSTLKSGKVDAGANVQLGPKELTVIAGVAVADTKKLEGALKKFVEIGQKYKQLPTVKFDAAKHGNVRFHTVSLPVPEDEDVSKVVGDKVDVSIGIGEKQAYLAFGNDSLSKLKQAIDKSNSEASAKILPMQLSLSLSDIFKFVAAIKPDPTVTAMADELAKSSDKDHVLVTAQSDAPGSATYRLTFEESVLKLIGQAGKLAAQKAGPRPR